MISKKLIQCRGGKNHLNEDLTAQTAGESGASQTSHREQENGAQPVADDELEAVTGGGVGQIIDSFRPVTYYCKYCSEKFVNMKEACEAHMQVCPENPANKK